MLIDFDEQLIFRTAVIIVPDVGMLEENAIEIPSRRVPVSLGYGFGVWIGAAVLHNSSRKPSYENWNAVMAREADVALRRHGGATDVIKEPVGIVPARFKQNFAGDMRFAKDESRRFKRP